MSPCATDGDLTICTTPYAARRHVQGCPTCGRRTRFVRRYGGAWYGDTWTCCACGDTWSTEGRKERPFRRGWRQEATAQARRTWTAALTPAAYAAFVRRDLEVYL